MNPNSTMSVGSAPLHVVLRRRRKELNLIQAQVAEALDVTPECITLWEGGRRRMELSKLPRIAKVLQLDAKQLCQKALAEFHPPVFEALFGRTGIHPSFAPTSDVAGETFQVAENEERLQKLEGAV